jgi:transcriptional regulator with XRE-family HTH domain
MTSDPCRRPIRPEEIPDLLRLARLLSETRRAAGLTRSQVARAASLSVRHVQRLEDGGRRTRTSTLERLALALDPDKADLLLRSLIHAAGQALAPESLHAERVARRRARRDRRR